MYLCEAPPLLGFYLGWSTPRPPPRSIVSLQSSLILTLMRIRILIQFFTIMRIRIPKLCAFTLIRNPSVTLHGSILSLWSFLDLDPYPIFHSNAETNPDSKNNTPPTRIQIRNPDQWSHPKTDTLCKHFRHPKADIIVGNQSQGRIKLIVGTVPEDAWCSRLQVEGWRHSTPGRWGWRALARCSCPPSPARSPPVWCRPHCPAPAHSWFLVIYL